MTADEWRAFLSADGTRVAPNGGWFSVERPPDVVEVANPDSPQSVEDAERWFALRGATLRLEYLGDEVYADVTHPDFGQLSSFEVGQQTDEVARAVAGWKRQTTRNR